MSHGSGDGHDCQPFGIYRWWPGIAGRTQLVRGAHRTAALKLLLLGKEKRGGEAKVGTDSKNRFGPAHKDLNLGMNQ